MPQKLRCEVSDVIDHGERVYSIILKPGSRVPRFLAGQFLHLALDEYTPGDFWPDSRPFSVASAPNEREHIRITYAVKGSFTGRMETEIHTGRQVWIKMPFGEFTVNPGGKACLLAGGTGITAFTAFLAYLPKDSLNPVYLFYGARQPELLIYRSLVETVARRCPNLRPQFFAEQANDGTDCLPGRIDLETIWKSIPEPLGVTYYLSGPPVMLQALRHGLGERGVDTTQILTDAWE